MELSYIEKHVASSNLVLNSCYGPMAQFSTVLRNEHVIITYSLVARGITNITCYQELESSDIDFLEELLGNHIYDMQLNKKII